MCCTWLAENTGRKNVAKNRHLGTIARLCRTISSQLRHISTIGKKNLLSSNISSTCIHNMVNFSPLYSDWDRSGSLRHPCKFQRVSRLILWQRYCTASSSGLQPNFTALNRGRHLCSTGRPSRWVLAHILVQSFLQPWPRRLQIRNSGNTRDSPSAKFCRNYGRPM